jgi:hypothetical protein
MTTTSGILAVIDVIAIQESHMAARSHMEVEDLQQEIRFACIKALTKFDPTRIGPSPYAFLKRCAKNHLYNLNRGTYVPNNPPCVRCPLWIDKTCSINEEGCDKIVKYRQSMDAKATIKHPDNLGDYDKSVFSQNEAFVLDSSIRDMLPSGLINDYNLMVAGVSINSKNRSRIRKLVKDMLNDD